MEITSYFADDLFTQKTVFVTGGSSGINLGIARNFAAVDAQLTICGRTLDKLEAAQAELEDLGAEVLALQADVRDYDALVAAFGETRDTFGPIHTLVCGAAGNFLAPSEELSANGFKTVVDIDLNGSFNAARAAFEQLKATSGNVIFVSAGQSFTPYPAQAHCGAAKAGVDNLMRNLALEWGPHGIRANSIAPGPVEDTEGVRRLIPEAAREKLKRSIPLGRFGRADEIGRAAVFLASPLASYVTGTRLRADGGQNLPGSGVFAQMLQEASS